MLFTLVRARPPVATLFPYTTLFRSAATDGAATGLPHSLQKRLLCRLGCPHAGQTASRRPPQPAQNLAPAGLSCRHWGQRSEEHTSELQSLTNLVCRLLLEKKKPQDQ